MSRSLALCLLALVALVTPATAAHAAPRFGWAEDTPVLRWIKPNLTVDSLQIIEGRGDVVQRVHGMAVVRNTGLKGTGPCGVSTYTTVDGKLTVQHFWFSNGLAPGESFTMTWQLPQQLYNTTQKYVMSVFADPYDSVYESDEGDNAAGLTIFA